MIFVIVVLTAIVTSCVAQDLMTCSRTSDTFQLPSALPSTSSLQNARPGKRGAIGPKGSMGLRGPKGQKGAQTDESEMNRLQERVATLEQQVAALRQSIPAAPESGWFNGLNGYQYKLTETADTWERTREACQALGGDLAVHGMQRSDLRKFISSGVSVVENSWIGLSDRERERAFKWVDGTPSTPDIIIWNTGEPNGGRNENCVMIYPRQDSYRSNDARCSATKKGICEKLLT